MPRPGTMPRYTTLAIITWMALSAQVVLPLLVGMLQAARVLAASAGVVPAATIAKMRFTSGM